MFKNLVALVTGGSSGLGLATAQRFIKNGAKVIICDLPTSNGNEIAKTIGSNAQFLPSDVRSSDEIDNLVNNIEKQHGKLNVLVNCAGIGNAYILYNFLKNRPRKLEDFQSVVQTNLFGTYNVIRASVKLMQKNEPDENGLRGVIVNTAGIEGPKGQSGQIATAAASNGIIHMTRPLAAQLQTQGIRVVTISPGLFRTPLTDMLVPEVEKTVERECFIGVHRMGDPDEFAHMVQTIIQAPHINGANINMACGLNLFMSTN